MYSLVKKKTHKSHQKKNQPTILFPLSQLLCWGFHSDTICYYEAILYLYLEHTSLSHV